MFTRWNKHIINSAQNILHPYFRPAATLPL